MSDKLELEISVILNELDNINPCTWVGLKSLMYLTLRKRPDSSSMSAMLEGFTVF